MEGLNLNNIYGEQDIETLFEDPVEKSADTTVEEPTEKNNKEIEEPAEVSNPEDLFEDSTEKEDKQPESVSRESKDTKEQEDASADNGGGTSPNLYSSFASAMAVEGILPNLDEETVKKADSAEAISDLIDMEVNARLDERQQRVAKALDNGVEPSDIRKYEGTINYIDSITDELLSEESEKGEQLRRSLIYQDYINKGYSNEKAQKLTERTIDAGTDIEDAKDALQSNKEYFQDEYDKLLKEAQKQADEEKEKRKKQVDDLKNSILKDKDLMGDLEISNEFRKKAIDNISKPIYKDPDTGEYLTAVQKYEMEHRSDFLKYTGLIYTLTDGFKNFDNFVKGKVKKEMKKGFRELEQQLANTQRNSNGTLRMVSSKSDPESFIGRGLKLAL